MLTAMQTSPDHPIPTLGEGYTQDELHAMQRAVIALFAKWNVSDVDAAIILGGVASKTFRGSVAYFVAG